MSNAIFSYNGIETTIQCLEEDKMKNICNKYSSKINININLLLFIYGGNQINFDLSFKEQANSIDKERKEMNILVYKKEENELKCPKCGEIINIDKYDNLIKFNFSQNDMLNELKNEIDIINNSNEINKIKNKIRVINLIINNIIEENIKNTKNIQNIINNNFKEINNINNNIINSHNNLENKFGGKRISSSSKKDENFEKNLLYSVDFEKTEEIAEMIKENAEKVISVVNDDMNILQRATFLNKISSVKTIVKELKIKFDKNNDSITYNNFINSKNKRGYTSLHYSIVCGHIEIYIFLLKNGADRTIATNSGYNNLILACQTKRTYIFLDEIKNQIINKQLDLSILFTFCDKNKATLLHWAAFSDYLFGVQYLLSLKDKNNIAYKNININFINFINSKDNDNMTPLQYAIMNNSNKAIFELMLLDDINLYNKDANDRDCYDYAESMDNEKFRETLKIKNSGCNCFTRFLKIFILLLHNVLIYFILLPLINKFYILIIQLSLSFLIIIIMILIKCIINPGNKKGNYTTYKNVLFNINENSIYKDLTEVIRFCPFCFLRKEKTNTKHCPICNTCVENSIKHDTFFNICIGRKNYCLYAIFKLIFIFYLLYFLFISFWSVFFNLNNNNVDEKDIIFPLIKCDFFYHETIISIVSFGTIFIFLWIFFITIWSFYKECRLKNNNNALKQSSGLNKNNTINSRKDSIL